MAKTLRFNDLEELIVAMSTYTELCFDCNANMTRFPYELTVVDKWEQEESCG